MVELVLNSRYMAAFSDWLVAFHHSTGLNVEDFAKALGVPWDVLADWEMETIIPTKTQVETLAEYNGKTVADLFCIESDQCPEDIFVEYEEPENDALVSDKPWAPIPGEFKKDKAAFDAFITAKKEEERKEREEKLRQSISASANFSGYSARPPAKSYEDEPNCDTGYEECEDSISRSETVEKILNLYNSLDKEGQEAVSLAVGGRTSDYD